MSIDSKLADWFKNDMSNAFLRAIYLTSGNIRGLKPFKIQFDFPISVVAGGNGSGKTTLLALAACAFHNNDDGFKLTGRKLPYFTISDFFIHSSDEVSTHGISIVYGIAYDNWRVEKSNESKAGVFYQALTKIKGGKWRTYENRVRRNVVFFGIDRVVPHSEKSVSKSYRSIFKKTLNGCEEKVRQSVGIVLNKNYEEFHFKSHSKYRLPFVKQGNLTYSGFNMGAGENALFEIFYNLHVCPQGSLAIIDEIELGLHAQAQKRLMDELKRICLERKLQVICTTHSSTIIAQVPSDGRFFIRNHSGGTDIISGISPFFATGLLSGLNSEEMIIYVEDDISKDLLEATFDKNLRSRILVRSIGSASAVLTLMAGLRKEGRVDKILAILDGDKSKNYHSNISTFLKKLESYEDKGFEENWIRDRLLMLPGTSWPEKWILEKLAENLDDNFVKLLDASKNEVLDAIQCAIHAGKHKEYYELSQQLFQDINYLKKIISKHIAIKCKADFLPIAQKIISTLQ